MTKRARKRGASNGEPIECALIELRPAGMPSPRALAEVPSLDLMIGHVVAVAGMASDPRQ